MFCTAEQQVQKDETTGWRARDMTDVCDKVFQVHFVAQSVNSIDSADPAADLFVSFHYLWDKIVRKESQKEDTQGRCSPLQPTWTSSPGWMFQYLIRSDGLTVLDLCTNMDGNFMRRVFLVTFMCRVSDCGRIAAAVLRNDAFDILEMCLV
jgi:hypothetical protein